MSTFQTRKTKRQRKKRFLTMGIMLVLLVGILFIVLILLNPGEEVSADEPATAAQAASASPAAQSRSRSNLSILPPATGPFDLGGVPPLFNYENEIPEGYLDIAALVDVGNGQSMEPQAAAAFMAMQAAAAEEGVALTPVSGYRSHEQQTNNYNASIQRYRNQGYSEDEAVRMTQRYYAIPGTSEHEVGLAMDINLVDDSFDQTPAFYWLQEHCNEYGFLFRYRKEKEDITHIAYEPWHYRFVGANHAKKIEELGLTLEEYTALLEKETDVI